MDKETHLKLTTRHYKFQLTIKESIKPLHMFVFRIGEKDNACLEGNIILENNTSNTRYNSVVNTAKLIKIDALQECSLDDISDEYMAKYSLGTELLDAMVFFINSQFPMIETVSLDDASYIPCIRDSKDTLDLLVYSIALYKKTWYEEKLNAYIKPAEKYEEYRRQVESYASRETKSKMEFIDIYKMVLQGSEFSKEVFDGNYGEFERLFKESDTLPEFFKSISKKINRSDKCRFYKDWLETFIASYVRIERKWHFDLFPKIQTLDGPIRKTRKNKGRK